MSNLTFYVDEKQRLNSLYSASWAEDDSRPSVLVTFELSPDLGEAEASAMVTGLLARYGIDWLRLTPDGWFVDGTSLKSWDARSKNWLPAWVAGAYEVMPKVATWTRQRVHNQSRATEFTFEISEHLAAMSGVASAGTPERAEMLIQLQSKQPFKSIEPITEAIPLSELTILTGLNGSGKTHTLQGIAEGPLQLLVDGKEINPKRLIDHAALTPPSIEKANADQEANQVKEFLEVFGRYRARASTEPNYRLSNQLDARLEPIATRISATAGKEARLLSDDDIVRNWPLNTSSPQNVLANTLSSTFRRYYDRHRENRIAEFENLREGAEEPWMTDEEFVTKHGPAPWDLINRFLEEAGLTIRVDPPRKQLPGVPYEIGLTKIVEPTAIPFRDLSSGEKIFLSIGAAIYNADTNDLFPRVLLLDEPDSHLHPLMARKLLGAILNVFVKERRLIVIMATHSATTVALAPEESIYSVSPTAPHIAKVSKDRALSQLTAGVPSLSVNYENRRQVFVESKYDAYFYERLYIRLKASLVSEISLDFIPSDIGGTGSSGAVKTVVQRLVSGGNKSVFGIIDWDLHNTEDGAVKVLGEGNRYSIENYIFDPLMIAALLLRERLVDRNALGLEEHARHIDIAGYDEATLQAIVDRVVGEVAATIGSSLDIERVTGAYVGGKSVSIPVWYLKYQGHELESLLKKTYGNLQNFHREGELKKAVIDLVIEDVPELIPCDVLNLFQSLQAIP